LDIGFVAPLRTFCQRASGWRWVGLVRAEDWNKSLALQAGQTDFLAFLHSMLRGNPTHTRAAARTTSCCCCCCRCSVSAALLCSLFSFAKFAASSRAVTGCLREGFCSCAHAQKGIGWPTSKPKRPSRCSPTASAREEPVPLQYDPHGRERKVKGKHQQTHTYPNEAKK